ncbi:MAG: hypothetical protein ABEJ24_02525 [Candidatus Magasanikbacteria bacterium]
MLKESTFRKALHASWDLAWHHKVLWIFGLFAAFLGQMGLFELFIKVGLIGTDYSYAPPWFTFDYAALGSAINALAFSLQGWLLLAWFIVLFGGVGIVLLFVSVSSQGALIDSAAQFIEEEKLPDTSVAWHSGVHHFWRLLAINIIKKVLIFVFALGVGYSTILAIGKSAGVGITIFTVSFLLAVVLGAIVSFLSVYAACYVVVDESSLIESIKKSYKLFKNHWLVSIEIGAVILALNFVFVFLVVASLFLLFMPTLMLWLIAVTIVSKALYTIGVVLASLIFIVFMAFAGSIFKVFTTSAWTYLFMKMHHHGLLSRIKHLSGLHKFEQ